MLIPVPIGTKQGCSQDHQWQDPDQDQDKNARTSGEYLLSSSLS